MGEERGEKRNQMMVNEQVSVHLCDSFININVTKLYADL